MKKIEQARLRNGKKGAAESGQMQQSQEKPHCLFASLCKNCILFILCPATDQIYLVSCGEKLATTFFILSWDPKQKISKQSIS